MTAFNYLAVIGCIAHGAWRMTQGLWFSMQEAEPTDSQAASQPKGRRGKQGRGKMKKKIIMNYLLVTDCPTNWPTNGDLRNIAGWHVRICEVGT